MNPERKKTRQICIILRVLGFSSKTRTLSVLGVFFSGLFFTDSSVVKSERSIDFTAKRKLKLSLGCPSLPFPFTLFRFCSSLPAYRFRTRNSVRRCFVVNRCIDLIETRFHVQEFWIKLRPLHIPIFSLFFLIFLLALRFLFPWIADARGLCLIRNTAQWPKVIAPWSWPGAFVITTLRLTTSAGLCVSWLAGSYLASSTHSSIHLFTYSFASLFCF